MRTMALASTFFVLRGMAALWRGEDSFAHYLQNLLSLERAATLSERDMFSLIFVLCVHFLSPFKKCSFCSASSQVTALFSVQGFQCVLSIIFSLGWQCSIRLAEGSSSRKRAGLLGTRPTVSPFPSRRSEDMSSLSAQILKMKYSATWEQLMSNTLWEIGVDKCPQIFWYACSLTRARPLRWELISTQYFTKVLWSRHITLFQIRRHRPQSWGVLPWFTKQRQRLA